MRWFRNPILPAIALVSVALVACAGEAGEPVVESLGSIMRRTAPPQPDTAVVAPVPEPGMYRIEFTRYINGREEPTRFTRRVVRPFDTTGEVTRSLGFADEAAGGESRVTFVRPLLGDPRPRLYPPQATKTATRRVAGRLCDSYRIGGEELCIDGAGLVLMNRDDTVLDVAREVEVADTAKSAEELAASLAKGFTDKARGSIRPIHPDSAPPGTDYSLDAPPAGFTFVGRYAVAPLTAEVLKRTLAVVANIVDVYVRGADALIVERGGKLDRTTITEGDIGALDEATDVDLGALGTGKVGIGGVPPFGYREVRAFPSTGRYIVVAGTLPPDELVAITRSLRQWPGTQLRYLDR